MTWNESFVGLLEWLWFFKHASKPIGLLVNGKRRVLPKSGDVFCEKNI